LVEIKDLEHKLKQQLLVDLKQFVARVALEHIDQRLAGMAVGIKARALHHRVDLAAQVRNGAGRARVDGRREQADDAELSYKAAFSVEALDADVIHDDAAVDARAHVGLGDDERLRLFEKLHDLRGDGDKLVPTPQYFHFARAQDAEPGFVFRLDLTLGAGKGIFAQA